MSAKHATFLHNYPLPKIDEAKKQVSSESRPMRVYSHYWPFCAGGHGEIPTIGYSENKPLWKKQKLRGLSKLCQYIRHTYAMKLSTSGLFTVKMAESNDVSYDTVCIIIRYFDQDSRLVKKWSFSNACSKVLKGFYIALISFRRLPHSSDMTEFFSDSALPGISKHT